MTLFHILIFTAFALLVRLVLPARARGWALLAGSVAAIYWLQPSTPVRNLDFWFPTGALGLTVFVWAITRPAITRPLVSQPSAPSLVEDQSQKEVPARAETPSPQPAFSKSDLAAGAVLIGLVLAIGLTRYLEPLCCLTPSRPPELLRVVLALCLGSLAATLPARAAGRRSGVAGAAIVLILLLFIILKTEPLGRSASAWLRAASGQDAGLASLLDLPWLGFSYLAFRLLHVLRDYQAGKLPAYSLGEFVTYALFFPAYTAGPIDRAQHFVPELRKGPVGTGPVGTAKAGPAIAGGGAAGARVVAAAFEPAAVGLTQGGWRIVWGAFKKFALADSLALISLSAQNAPQLQGTGWAWVLLYAYTLRIYFDFSGYTDIALGLARLMGISLPENFEHPYLKTNLTAFWNSWHITLAQWFRAYFFNPLTRALRTRPQKLPAWAIILIGQMGTMLLIGLWHGVTWNFCLWGAWHGLGLYLHNRWSDWLRPRLPEWAIKPQAQRLLSLGGWLLTFHYVALGWVWFALPTPQLAIEVFKKLF